MSLKKLTGIVLLLTFMSLTSCKQNPEMNLLDATLIPKPVSVTATGSSFELNGTTKIVVGTDDLTKVGNFFSELIQPATGLNVQVETGASSVNTIFFGISELSDEYGNEGYQLSITEDGIQLTASAPEGIVRGIQTLIQAFPDEIQASAKQEKAWLVATGDIQDYPNFEYRGAMLDVARHFFSVEEVKRLIDLITSYKINTLHLHLSDDQGWRVEIKSWPNLTAHGGSTEVGGGEGGFYTQEQYKDIVAYAAERYITVIPEIDMPGHTNAALASYAELNIDGKATELYSGIEVGFSTLDTDKEITYKFVEDVVRELVAMTPGPYFHIGGDESHATPMEDYIPFINRAQEIVKAAGKKVIGWDEIAHTDLVEGSTVQFWDKAENAKKGIEKGAKVLMSPAKRVYLDMQYDSLTPLGLHWAAYIEIDEAYNWDPETLVDGITRNDILGVESALWSETIKDVKDIEYMVFPRIVGHSEIGWTRASQRNWDDYKSRLKAHLSRLKIRDINYYESPVLEE